MTSKLFKHFDFDEIELLYGKNNAFTYFAYSFFMKRIWIVHCFSHRFFARFLSFFMIFAARFRDRFLLTFSNEKGTKMTSKIDPRGDPFDQKGSKSLVVSTRVSVVEPTFFRASMFQCFQVPFRRNFGQGSALLAPFWPLLAPCWVLLAPFWEHVGRSWLSFARNNDNFESIFAGVFSQRIWSQNEKIN